MSEGINFLAAVVQTRSLSALRRITEDHFVDEDEAEVYEYINHHLERHGEIPSADAVFEQTEIDLPEVEDSVDYHLSVLNQRKLYNDIREPYNRLRSALGSRSMQEVEQIVGEMSAATMVNRDRNDLLPVGEVGSLVLERYEAAHMRPGLTGVPSGWPTLDEDSAGYQSGDLVIWAARPETGKTWLLLRQAAAAHEAGANVLFVTMEMPLIGIGNRFFGMQSNINPRLIRNGRMSNRASAHLRQVIDSYRTSRRLHFFQGNMGQDMNALHTVVVERSPDIVLIDGVYLMRSSKAPRNTDRFQSVAYSLDDLKTLALNRNIPVVGTTQFNRTRGNSRRRSRNGDSNALETLGYTDAYSTHASLIYSVSKPPVRAQNQDVRIIQTEKGREGESGVIAVNFLFSPTNFDETDMEQVPDDQEAPDMDWMRNR